MKGTVVSGFIEQVIKEVKSTIIIYQPPYIPSSFRDTFLLANIHQLTCIHLLPIIRFWIIARDLIHIGWLTDKCLCLLFEARWNCEGVDG